MMSARGSASQNGNHHRVAAKVVSKIERGRPATSVHGYVLAAFRARAQRSGARARSIKCAESLATPQAASKAQWIDCNRALSHALR